MTAGSPDREAARRHEEAVAAGKFGEALSIVTTDLIVQLLALLDRYGLQIEFPRPPENSIEFFGGIASAIQAQIDLEGDRGPYVLAVGLDLSTALLGLQSLLQGGRTDSLTDHDDLAQVLLQAMAVGSRAEQLGLSLSGHFEEFFDLKTKSAEMRERRRRGAEIANEKRRAPRSIALRDAQQRCAANPRLSNEDLALRIRAALGLSTSIRTMSGWMRDWRRNGQLPPLRK